MLLQLFRARKLTSPLQLIFTPARIVAIFKAVQGLEKIYKFPFEEVEHVHAGHPPLSDYPCSVGVLTKTLWSALVPHALILGKQNEICLQFSSQSLSIVSREDSQFSSQTVIDAADCYAYKVDRLLSITIIRSEFIGLVTCAERTESLLLVYFGLDDAPVVIDVEGCGEGVHVQYIMSALVEPVDHESSRPIPEESIVAESDTDQMAMDDEFAIPGTPDYVY